LNAWDRDDSVEHAHAVMAHINSRSPFPVLGVIQMKRNPFLDSIWNRDDVTVIQVTPDNRDAVPERLFDIFGVET